MKDDFIPEEPEDDEEDIFVCKECGQTYDDPERAIECCQTFMPEDEEVIFTKYGSYTYNDIKELEDEK